MMTTAVGDRILKDVNGNIGDHLHSHVHLTNCIHLKNHMHKHSPISADRTLMRDLVVLQRSRSLRDPAASPQSWHSPPVVGNGMLLGTGEKDERVSGRRSIGLEHQRESERLSVASPPVAGQHASEVATRYVRRRSVSAAAAVSERSSKEGTRERRRMKKEASGQMCQGDEDLSQESVPEKSELSSKSLKLKGTNKDGRRLRTLSEQLEDVPAGSDTAASSRNHTLTENIAEEAEANLRQLNGLHRVKRRKFRGVRRNRPSIATRDHPSEGQNEISVASNSFHQGRAPQRYDTGEGLEEHDDQQQHISGINGNGCRIPWNWSRIHHRGKSFIDMAGRSLSCGLSESKSRKGGSTARGMDFPDLPVMSENSSSSTGEALPLLLDASGSQGSIDHSAWFHDYLGELGIFSDSLLKQETDSDLASEGRSHEQLGFRMQQRKRHQNLSQKYMPRTFRDLVGQHLVVQALSNAIAKRKIGLLYLFYGPHGTGKTSCARIFARALNCQSLENPRPCGNCNSCIAENTVKGRRVREIGPVSNIEFEKITELLDHAVSSPQESQYRVFIFDECDTLSSECWSAILKVVDRVPRRVVFILVCSSLDALPHVVISRSQKFFFPKLKDADMIYTLRWIATKEDLDIDKDALKLIASRSDGSLRDAEMTLEQLSLLGKRISLGLVQELIGVISDEKLVDLLDLALSADTVNTVKNLRDIMESGVEPLALMSQLATVITDILAGSFDCRKERPRRKFFRRRALSKDDMEKLRQALKTLSEAEKQLRMSNDKMTWLTAALLQLAPDQQYILPSSSEDTSFSHSPDRLANASSREQYHRRNAGIPPSRAGSSRNAHYNGKVKGLSSEGNVHTGGIVSQAVHVGSKDKGRMSKARLEGISGAQDMEEIWFEVLEKIPIHVIKEFMYQEAKLVSVSYGAAPTVQLLFSSHLAKSKAEKFRIHILQAFESVLCTPVTIEIRCETRKGSRLSPVLLPAEGLPNRAVSPHGINSREIIEVGDTPNGSRSLHKNNEHAKNGDVRGVSSTQRASYMGDTNRSMSLVRGKVSLAHVVQQVEGCSQNSGWSKRKAISIAEKLEQENLRLESRSRGLLCWNPPKFTRKKLSRWKIRTRKARTLLTLISCGRCLSVRSKR